MFNMFNNSNMGYNPNQSKYANNYNQQMMNEMMGKFQQAITDMNDNQLQNLINKAKQLGISDSQISQGIEALNKMRSSKM